MEAGSLIRAVAVLLAYPVAWLLERCGAGEGAALKLLLFIACAGLRLQDIEGVGRAVLPRFFAEDVQARAWKTLSSIPTSCLCVVSKLPRPMVHSFAYDQLGAHELIAPELHVTASGRCLGFLRPRPPPRRLSSSQLQLISTMAPTSHKYLQFTSCLTKKSDGHDDQEAASMSDLQNPVIFHDGRLVRRPTPAMALLVLVWMPLGFMLAVLRVMICSRAPFWCWASVARVFGISLELKGEIAAARRMSSSGSGLLIVSNHRTLLDPIFISLAMARPVTAVTYSLSRVSEVLSPIRTVRLKRDAKEDLRKLRALVVEKGQNVVVCPEGTTSREALLLRFSALFAEVTDNIMPVAVHTRPTLFHGTTTRGFKALDPFFFLMNPVPTYELVFIDKLPSSMTCGAGGKSRYEVANYVQELIASTLGFQCSSFTRPDKYNFLAGNDGSVVMTSPHRTDN